MSDRTTIYVCANHETLADGIIDDRQFYSDSINEAISDVCRWIDDQGCDSKCEGYFADWHGGKFYRAGETIGADVYGHKNGGVCVLAKNPSNELKAIVDAASDKLSEKLHAIGKLEEQDRAEREAEAAAENE